MTQDGKKVIVSLTSWPPRIGNLYRVLDSILDQTVKPDEVDLNLSIEEFPKRLESLPKYLIDLIIENSDIVKINWVEKNTGVFKKMIPSLQKHYDEPEYYLLSIDDDFLYRKDYIEFMINKLNEYNADSFCSSEGYVIGNRMIYRSSLFKSEFWEKLTDEVVSTRIDDTYITHYLNHRKCRYSKFRPNDVKEMIVSYNPVSPNSHNPNGGAYSVEDIRRANEVIGKIKFTD